MSLERLLSLIRNKIVSLGMHVCMSEYTCTSAYTIGRLISILWMHFCMYLVYLYTCIWVCIYPCMYAYLYVYVHVCTYMYACIYLRTCMYNIVDMYNACMYVCMRLFVTA